MSDTAHDPPPQRASGTDPQVSPLIMPNAAPLPWLSMVVLSITMLGEFLSANVSAPFILFMVAGFGRTQDDATVAYRTGILVSVFFITQFITSLLWATIAERHGRRVVLLISLLGSAITCSLFGTSTSLKQAIVIRLLQGVFAGAIGVARSAVPQITNTSNEGRAYSILGFCWGFGGVAGAIIGGTFESPVSKWPSVFDVNGVFGAYPYLLPCLVASSITMVGALACLFLDSNAGPRERGIALPLQKNGDEYPGGTDSGSGQQSRGWIGTLLGPLTRAQGFRSSRNGLSDHETTSRPLALASANSDSRQSGSAYHLNSAALRGRFQGERRDIWHPYRGLLRHPTYLQGGQDLNADTNLARRLLIANEFSVTNMADLWINAAVSGDETVLEDLEAHSLGPRTVASVISNSNSLPGIYQNTGLGPSPRDGSYSGPDSDALPLVSPTGHVGGEDGLPVPVTAEPVWTQLPIAIIVQYGILALHSTTHDQVFYSYLLSPSSSGGLGLKSSHFSQLIATMCLAQIAYQFYLYPNVGPPRGRFSHLTMFRLGSILFIPAYLSVILYRPLRHGDNESTWLLMILLSLSTAVRYCAITFAYTSVAILLNYLAPPRLNGLANGIAQSTVSLARFFGPITGGYLWSASTEKSPGGYWIGFMVVSLITTIAIIHSYRIR